MNKFRKFLKFMHYFNNPVAREIDRSNKEIEELNKELEEYNKEIEKNC